MTRMPVASAVGSLRNGRPQVVLADVVVDDHPRAGEAADEIGHVAELVPCREVEDDRDLAIGQFLGLRRRGRSARRASPRGRGSRTAAASGWR